MKSHTRIGTLLLIMFLMMPAARAGGGVEQTGTAIQIILPATAYALTFTHHDPDGRRQFYKAFFSSMAVTYALKLSIDDNRPYPSTSEQSFVSAHTAAAFSGAAFMQRRYGWRYGAPAYLAATYVGWSRYHVRAHDTDDIVRGAAIGIAGAYLFARPIGRHAMLYPIFDAHTVGLGVSACW